MKDRVYLVDLGTGTDRSLLPLACGLISAYSKSIPQLNEAYEFEIRMLGQGLDELVEELVDPAVIAFSCYVWNFLGTVEVSNRLKELYPDALIVWGGPSIPAREARIAEFMEAHSSVDILVHQEGELTFADILLRRLTGASLKDCQGITYRTNATDNRLSTTEPRQRIQDFAQIPSPFLDGTFDAILDRYGDHIVGALWETSRGCPFRCSFCDWGNALVNKVNRVDIERVVAEIEWVSSKRIHYVYATDANFGIAVDRDLEIAKRFADISKISGFPNTLVLNWTKNSHNGVVAIADTLNGAGITTNTTLSVQSFHPPTLKAIQRANIRLETYLTLKRAYHDRGLATYTELILGLPEETLETFLAGVERSLSPRLQDQLSIYLLVMLENTHLAELETRTKYKLETKKTAVGLNRRRFKYPRFGEDEIVIGNSTMPRDDWDRAYEISFMTTGLYTLRPAFFIAEFLRQVTGNGVVDFIGFIIDTVTAHSDEFEVLASALEHVRCNRQLILDGVSSVSPVPGGDGVSLTPHEAIVFMLLSRIDQTYEEMGRLARQFCEATRTQVSDILLTEALKYQKMRMPVFAPESSRYEFETNIPRFFEQVTKGLDAPDIDENIKTTVDLIFAEHDHQTEVDFNLRRVSSGYTLNIVDVVIQEGNQTDIDRFTIPLARNTNMGGSFSSYAG